MANLNKSNFMAMAETQIGAEKREGERELDASLVGCRDNRTNIEE